MQWDDSENAGFSKAKPWLKVNPNYRTINAAVEIKDPDSVYNYYRKLLEFRKNSDLVIDGDFTLTNADDTQLFSYERRLNGKTLYVFCNFSNKNTKKLDFKGKIILSNYNDVSDCLRPYEAKVFEE